MRAPQWRTSFILTALWWAQTVNAALEMVAQAYQPLVDGSYYKRPDAIPGPVTGPFHAHLIRTSAKSAELIKHASNAFLAMKISFINAVASVCEAVGADVEQVREGIGSDSRIGRRFLSPGIGYGGSCFPKDLLAFRSVARENGCHFGLLDETVRVNEEQRNRFMRKVRKALWTLKGKKLAVLGLAFKNGTDDMRESPAVSVIKALLKEGCSITAYDPAAMDRAAEEFGPGSPVRFASGPYEALDGADACLVLTEWEDFAALDPGPREEAFALSHCGGRPQSVSAGAHGGRRAQLLTALAGRMSWVSVR